MTEDEIAGYELVVAFTDQSPQYAHGFEVGKIYERLSRINVGEGSAAAFHTLIHPENAEVLRRIAEAKGWRAVIEPSKEAPAEWYTAEFTKVGPSRDKPNPHGLRVVGS
jgi:hypothetical protein